MSIFVALRVPRRLPDVVGWLPRGGGLGPEAWRARHRGICVLLWAHAVVLLFLSLLRGQGVLHSVTEAAVVALFAVGAQARGFSASVRSASATLGLVTSSAAAVHLFNGVIEAHFHFFVMVAVVALYQAWMPFLLALVFVVVHHSVTGSIAPESVYNHPDAVSNPWLWGLVHGGFILAESVACLVYWRASDQALERERASTVAAQQAHRDLARAQELSGMGSWDWDIASDTVTWSDQLYVLAGVDRGELTPSIPAFLNLMHPEDRERVGALIHHAHQSRAELNFECRLVRPDGIVRTIHALGETVTDDRGKVMLMSGTCHDVTESRRLQDEIAHLAFHDPLTGLANRRLFLDRLDHALAHLRRSNGTCAILFIDLDDFKKINDDCGHAAGDALLVEVANRLRRSVRETDTIARFGGDEFAVLCEEADMEIASQTAERIAAELNRSMPIEGNHVVVGASIGISVAECDTEADALLHQADHAMYAVKTQRRQRDLAVLSDPVG